MVNIRKTTGADGKGIVYFLPDSLINNTMAAFNAGGKTPADLDKSAPYIGPARVGRTRLARLPLRRTGTASSMRASTKRTEHPRRA